MDAENKPFDADETELKVSEIKNGRSVWHRIRDKLIDDYTSRGFFCVMLSAGLHIMEPSTFPGTNVVAVMIAFMGASAVKGIFTGAK